MANKDNTAPKLVLSSPKKGSSDVSVTQDLIFVFNEDIQAGLGNIVISNGGADSQTISLSAIQTASSQFSIVGKTLIINPQNPLQPNSHYSVKIDSTAIQDLSGNKYAGISNATTVFFDTVDTLAPSMTKSLPTINTTNVLPKANIVLTFNEKIQAGRGNITLISDVDSRTIAITDKQIKISGNTLTFNPTNDLNVNSAYTVHLDAGGLHDFAPDANSTRIMDLKFTTNAKGDKQAPVLQSYKATESVSGSLKIPFQEAIKIGKGSFTLSDGTTKIVIAATDQTQVSILKNVLIIHPTQNFNPEKTYTLISPKGIVTDLVGNAFAPLTTKTPFTFDTKDKTPPSVTITDDQTTVAGSILYTFNLSEASATFTTDAITVINGTKGIFTPVSPTRYTLGVSPTANLVSVDIAAGKFSDNAGNLNALSATQKTQAVDSTAPELLSTTPGNHSLTMSKSGNIVLFFDENISKGTGDIVISNGTDTQTISVKDASQVIISNKVMTINPAKNLLIGGDYNVTFGAGVVVDKSGNAFAGLTSPTQLTFKVSAASTIKDTTSQSTSVVDILNAKALDGYLKEASVFADANGDGIQNPDEASAITDAFGNFQLENAKGSIIVSGGTDLSTGKPFLGTLKAPEGSSVVTPLTTVQQGFIEAGQTPAEAEKSVAKAFGFDASKLDLTTYDPIAEIVKAGTSAGADSIATQIMASSAKIANFLVTSAQVLQGAAGGGDNLSAQNASDALIKSLVSAITKDAETGDGKIDFSDAKLLKAVIIDGAKEANTLAQKAAEANGTAAPNFDAANFTDKIDKMADTVTNVLKTAAENITAAVENSKGGDGLALLGNMDKVSTFAQNDAGASLQKVAETLNVKDPNALIAALKAQEDLFTGDAATKAIVNAVVIPPELSPIVIPPELPPIVIPPELPPIVIPPELPPIVIPPELPPIVIPPELPPIVIPPELPPIVIPPELPPIVIPPELPPIVIPPELPPIVIPPELPPVVIPPELPPIVIPPELPPVVPIESTVLIPPVVPIESTVSQAGSKDASSAKVAFKFLTGNYSYTISKFATGDTLKFPMGQTVTVVNDNLTDGKVELHWALKGNDVTVILSDFTTTRDKALLFASDINKQFGTTALTYATNLPVSSNTAKTVTISADGSQNASIGNIAFTVSAGNYDYTIADFTTGDALRFPTGHAPSVLNESFIDGKVELHWVSSDGQDAAILLTGLTDTQDKALLFSSSFNNVFGANTLS